MFRFKALAVVLLVSSAAIAADATIQSDEGAVNAACAAESAAAGCGNETAGHGLVKCIHTFKKANKKTFKISPDCRAAMKKFTGDVHAKKAGAAR